MQRSVALTVNGRAVVLAGDRDRPLLDALRADLGLTAARFGCGEGQCGACMVVVDGRALPSCQLTIEAAAGRDVLTLEGLGDEADPHPLQRAFIEEQAMQCGYCISGVIMSAAALLARSPSPGDAEIRTALDGNLCRCGSHGRIVAAVRRAAEAMRSGASRG